MKIDIKKIAKQEVTLSELMNGREKIDTETIIKYHQEGITIDAAEEVTVGNNEENNRCYVYTIKEEPSKFAFSGFILTKIFDAIMSECDGDVEVFRKELSEQGLKVKLAEGKTKDKKPITTVEVL